ncbi:MAG: DNA methyltransferase [Byssovorax sp.]
MATTLRPVLERLGERAKPEEILALKVCDPAMGSGAFLVEACRQLADRLVAAWRKTAKTMPDLPPDEDPVPHARRLIAQPCIYGVDKNPLAVDLARLSMWLVTFAKEHPFTFVDHALREGDSLVGLSKEQISSLAFDVGKGRQIETVRAVVSKRVARAQALREEIHAIGDPPDNEALGRLWDEAKAELGVVKLIGDAMIASYFQGETDKARKKGLEDLGGVISTWLATGEGEAEIKGMVGTFTRGIRGSYRSIGRWSSRSVFAERGGFDCFMGNPPFLGGVKISGTLSPPYLSYLLRSYLGSGGQVDLVAFFFRRGFDLLQSKGTLGLIGTNTIAQGDTRASGLTWICEHGGSIYAATRRLKWPGQAAVIVSVVHITRGDVVGGRLLDGKAVEMITAFLFRTGGNDSPVRITGIRQKLSFLGSMVGGVGFTFDDGSDEATSIEVMRALVDAAIRVTASDFSFYRW